MGGPRCYFALPEKFLISFLIDFFLKFEKKRFLANNNFEINKTFFRAGMRIDITFFHRILLSNQFLKQAIWENGKPGCQNQQKLEN